MLHRAYMYETRSADVQVKTLMTNPKFHLSAVNTLSAIIRISVWYIDEFSLNSGENSNVVVVIVVLAGIAAVALMVMVVCIYQKKCHTRRSRQRADSASCVSIAWNDEQGNGCNEVETASAESPDMPTHKLLQHSAHQEVCCYTKPLQIVLNVAITCIHIHNIWIFSQK